MTRKKFQPARKGNPGSGKIGGSEGGPRESSWSLSLLSLSRKKTRDSSRAKPCRFVEAGGESKGKPSFSEAGREIGASHPQRVTSQGQGRHQ
jgi:hypothetical protein